MTIPLNRVVAFAGPYISVAAGGFATWLVAKVNVVGPLGSAATLGVMKTFRVYKPANETAGFLEVEHPGSRFLTRIKPPPEPPGPVAGGDGGP